MTTALILMAVAAAGAGLGFRLSRREPKVKLAPRWEAHVDDAIDAHRRYREVAREVKDDVLKAELDAIGTRLEGGIDTMRRVAERGQELDDGIKAMPSAVVLRRRLAALRSKGVEHDDGRWTSVAYQLQASEKARDQRDDILRRLDTLEAQLDAAVVQAIEMGLAADQRRVRAIGTAVESALGDLEALNKALVELDELD